MLSQTSTRNIPIVFEALPDYAAYILQEKPEAYIEFYFQLARDFNLPSLERFISPTDPELSEIGKSGILEFLTHVRDGKGKQIVFSKPFRFGISDDRIATPDEISISSHIRKQCLTKFIPAYTSDINKALTIIAEVDRLNLETEKTEINFYVEGLQNRLEEHSHFSEQIANTTPGVIFIFDLVEMREIYIKTRRQRMIGYEYAELEQMGSSIIRHLVHPEDLGQVLSILGEFEEADADTIKSVEYRMRYKSGNYHWVKNYGSVFKTDDKGKPIQIIVLAFDIDNEKTIEEQLLLREEQLLETQEIAELGSFEYNFETQQVDLDSQVKKILEQYDTPSAEELTSRIHKDDRQYVVEGIRDALENNTIFDGEYRYFVNNQEKILWSRVKLFYSKKGKTIRGTVMDITQRHQLLSELQQSQALYKESQALAHIGNWSFNLKTQRLIWSEELYRMYGLDPEGPSITYDQYLSIVHPDDVALLTDKVNECVTTKKPYSVYHRIVHSNGEIRIVHGLGNIILDSTGEPVRLIGTGQDVTERFHLLQELEDKETLYKQAQAITHIGNYVIDVSDFTIYWSEELSRIVGVDPNTSTSYARVLELIDAKDRKLVDDQIRNAINHQKSIDIYFHIHSFENKKKILHARGETITNKNGEVIKIIGTAQDVTERQNLFEKLEKSQELYKQAQALAHIGNWTWTKENNEMTCSEELFRIYDIEGANAKCSFEDFMNWIHEEDRALVRSTLQGVINNATSFDLIHRTSERNGATKILRVLGRAHCDEQGNLIHLFGTTQDVTEQKTIEAKLLENQRFIEKVADATPAIITSYNVITGKYRYVSGGLKRLLGHDPSIPLEKGIDFFISLVHPDDLEQLTTRNTKALEQANNAGGQQDEELVVEFLYRLKHLNGEYRWFRTYGTVFDRNSDNRVEQVLNISIDITNQIKAEEKISEQEHFIQHIADASPNVLYLFDSSSGSVIYVNKEITQILGYEPEEILNLKENIITDIYHPDDAIKIKERLKEYNKAPFDNSLFQFECRMKHKNGSWRWLLIRESVFKRNEQGLIAEVLGAALDITGRKQTEDALFQRTIELQQSNTNLEEFAYVASHDLQEPLRKISTFGDRLLNNNGPELNEDGKKYLKKIIDSSVRMQQMINDLLSISTLSGERSFVYFNLNAVLKEAIQTLDHIIDEKNAKIICSELPVARVIPSQFRQLFLNLLSNALKFSAVDRPPVIRISCSYLTQEQTPLKALRSDSKFLKIDVEDNGIGIDNRFADKIFTIFQRLHSKAEYEGTGIGLAICKKIVENHGGSINVHNNPDKGTTFTTIIPA